MGFSMRQRIYRIIRCFLFSFLIFSSFIYSIEKPRIAVANFGTSDYNLQSVAEAITSNIFNSLTQSKIVKVIDRSSLAIIFQEANLSMSGIVDGEQALGIGKLSGVDYLIVGRLHDVNQHIESDPQENGRKSAFVYLAISWRLYRISDGSTVIHLFDVSDGGSISPIGMSPPNSELFAAAMNFAYKNLGEKVVKVVSDAFPIETNIAAFKDFDEDERYAESVFLPLTEADGVYEGQEFQIGVHTAPNSETIWFFGELEIDDFENGLALADINNGEKFVKVDSINSEDGTSPYVVRSGPSILKRTDIARIAVLPLSGSTKQTYREILYELLCSQILQSRRFGVTDRGQVVEVMRERNLQLSGLTTENSLQALGTGVGADAILVGNVERCSIDWKTNEYNPTSKTCDVSFAISARLIDVGTGSVIWAGTMDNKVPIGAAIVFGLLGGTGKKSYSNEYLAIKDESMATFSQIVTSLMAKYPMESSDVGITMQEDEIQYIIIPFGFADGLHSDLEDIFFMMFETEEMMGKVREIPVAQLELSSVIDYHLSVTTIDEVLTSGKIDPNKKYTIRLKKEE